LALRRTGRICAGQDIRMKTQIDVIEVERIEGCGILVTFSDGTLAAYVAEELRALRPYRAPIENGAGDGCRAAYD